MNLGGSIMQGLKTLSYCPQLNQITGSVTASLLLCQLEYWFDKTHHKAFYKFLSPCEDTRYKSGDSWTEELGFSKAEFRNAFNKIGTVYKSKRAYLTSTNKFQGKLYLSYYDRGTNLTYYVRNTRALNKLLANQLSSVTYSKDYSPKNNFTSHKNIIPYDQILTLFHQHCPSLEKVTTLTQQLKRKITLLWNTLAKTTQHPLDQLIKCFQLVQASDFLCGRTKGHWRAFLSWIIKPEKFSLILSGKYNNYASYQESTHMPASSPSPHTTSTSTAPYKAYAKPRYTFNRMYEHGFDLEQLEAKERAYQQERYQDNLHNMTPKLLE